jgi:hypothetical protein
MKWIQHCDDHAVGNRPQEALSDLQGGRILILAAVPVGSPYRLVRRARFQRQLTLFVLDSESGCSSPCRESGAFPVRNMPKVAARYRMNTFSRACGIVLIMPGSRVRVPPLLFQEMCFS